MGVLCQRCGRQYDVTLFEFGRTIHCTCGHRVGREAQDRPLADPVRFAADAMLGSLARWLRLSGFDVTYEAHIPDERLVREAIEQHRVILTRDRKLPDEWRAPAVYLVEADRAREQLAEVIGYFGLASSVHLFRRCSLCNTPLEAATPEQIEAKVPPYVRTTPTRYRACPSCERVYWSGTHTDRVRSVLGRILGRDGD